MINFAKPSISQKEIKKVSEVLESGWITTGQLVKEFGEQLAAKIGAKYCLPVSSCTAALHVALICAGVGKGDEVITTPMTFVSTINVIKYLGAKPILVDIKPTDFILDETKIEEAITARTKAIIPVHYGGYAADLDKIRKIAKKYKLEIIEDAAHAYASKYKDEYIGQNSKFACFSFYPTKNITTIEGGALVTNDQKVYERACSVALHGISRDAWKRYTKEGTWRYDVLEIGYKYNLTDIQAAVGLVQLARIDELKARRQKIYNYYVENLAKVNGIEVLAGNEYTDPFRHLFVIKLNPKVIDKDLFISEMKKREIICSVHFIPVYEFTAYRDEFEAIKKKLINTNQAHQSCVSLPFSSDMTVAQAKEVVSAVKQVLKGQLDVFLTQMLGKPAYKLNSLNIKQDKNEEREFFTYISDYRTGISKSCEENGFSYISSRVELQKTLSVNELSPTNGYKLKMKSSQLNREEVNELQEIGKEIALTSRFYKDKLIGDLALKIYDEWIKNSFLNGYVDDYVIARKKGKIVGFATIKEDDELILDLIGVARSHQGNGVGKQMLTAIAAKYTGRKLKVGTEAENIEAMNFYVKNGFVIKNYKLIFHKHT